MESENDKYELVNKKYFKDIKRTLWQVRYLKNSTRFYKGDLGGWIESEYNLSKYGNCCVLENARVYNKALVCGNAKVCDSAKVHGDAFVHDNAFIQGCANIYGDAIVAENAVVSDYAKIFGYAQVRGCSSVNDHSVIKGFANIGQHVILKDYAEVSGDASICGNLYISGNSVITGDAYLHGTFNTGNNAHIDDVDKIVRFYGIKLSLNTYLDIAAFWCRDRRLRICVSTISKIVTIPEFKKYIMKKNNGKINPELKGLIDILTYREKQLKKLNSEKD